MPSRFNRYRRKRRYGSKPGWKANAAKRAAKRGVYTSKVKSTNYVQLVKAIQEAKAKLNKV